MSQDVLSFIRNPDSITCRDETAVFTCTVSTQFVRWVAEPHVSRNIDSVIIFATLDDIGVPFLRGPDDAISMVLVSINPLVTTMTINGNLTDNLDVECEATINGVSIIQKEQLMYQPGSKLINCLSGLEYEVPYFLDQTPPSNSSRLQIVSHHLLEFSFTVAALK